MSALFRSVLCPVTRNIFSPQQVLGIVEFGAREPARDLTDGRLGVHGQLGQLGADNPREGPDLGPELVVVLHTPAVEVLVGLQPHLVLLVDEAPQLAQLVRLRGNNFRFLIKIFNSHTSVF